MFISVITTVFNGKEYIEENINSISNQDFDDYEHIIVDDGSTDGTLEYLTSLVDDKLTIISLPHSGRGHALNKGLAAASGDYIAILDADDVASKFRLKVQKQIMDENPEYAVIATNCTVDRSQLADSIPSNLIVTDIAPRAFSKRNQVCHSSALIKKSVLDSVNGYNLKRNELFDYDLWIRLLMQGHRFARIESNLVFKRIHKNQKFEQRNRLKYLYGSLQFKLIVLSKFKKSFFDYLHPITAFVYGLLPNIVRKQLMDKLQ